MYLELSLGIIIIILLISNYVYEPDFTRVQQTHSQISMDQINCQDCTPSTKVKCKDCPIDDCYKCSKCAPNCDFCKTDCQKCKTNSCKPNCESCFNSICKPDCKKCYKNCTSNCSELKNCKISFKACKIVAEGLSFNLLGYATYELPRKIYYMFLTVITEKDKGHILTLKNTNSIISVFIKDNEFNLTANIDNVKISLKPWVKLNKLKPNEILLNLLPGNISLTISGKEFNKVIPGKTISQNYNVYLGGLPSDLRSLVYHPIDSYVGFSGCITSININGSIQLPQNFLVQGAFGGCQRKFI